MLMTAAVLVLLWNYVVLVFVVRNVAFEKYRSTTRWTVLSLLVHPVFALLALAAMPEVPIDREAKRRAEWMKLREKGIV